MRSLKHPISRLRHFTRFCGETKSGRHITRTKVPMELPETGRTSMKTFGRKDYVSRTARSWRRESETVTVDMGLWQRRSKGLAHISHRTHVTHPHWKRWLNCCTTTDPGHAGLISAHACFAHCTRHALRAVDAGKVKRRSRHGPVANAFKTVGTHVPHRMHVTHPHRSRFSVVVPWPIPDM